jgi:hypothetical protein
LVRTIVLEIVIEMKKLKPIKEVTLSELKIDYDWRRFFADHHITNDDKVEDNISPDVEVVPPGAKVSDAPVSVAYVKRVIAAVNGETRERDWMGVFEMVDGRFLIVKGGHGYKGYGHHGWDYLATNRLKVAKTLKDAIRFGLLKSERLELNLPLID